MSWGEPRCSRDKTGLSGETMAYLKVSQCRGPGLERNESGGASWAGQSGKKPYSEVDQMFQRDCRPVGRVEECLGST